MSKPVQHSAYLPRSASSSHFHPPPPLCANLLLERQWTTMSGEQPRRCYDEAKLRVRSQVGQYSRRPPGFGGDNNSQTTTSASMPPEQLRRQHTNLSLSGVHVMKHMMTSGDHHESAGTGQLRDLVLGNGNTTTSSSSFCNSKCKYWRLRNQMARYEKNNNYSAGQTNGSQNPRLLNLQLPTKKPFGK